ncbi:hypothetical protein ZIOFF_061768 [Zingiber officinale]|uniref:EF-hand domain-containing protein n=1 Tax=Zingiber officinale TaxID=94328 RepID=A0A8J5KA34_ZINOF|nr:hypothetical protein ZIOFF_061768 [Zingiber officinale]
MSSSAGNPKTAVATGYPDTAVVIGCPVPASGSNGSYAPPPPRSRYTTICIFLSRYWILAMAVIMALVILAVFIIIPVLFLVPRMPEFAVSSACVTGFNLSSAQQQQLSASFDLNLTVHSPNRLMRIYYERVTASVLYASDILSENPLAPFDQGKGETTVLRFRLAVVGEYVNSDVARGIESDRGRGDGAVGFNVIAESLPEEEIVGLKELFKMIDTDNSGTIIFDELKEGLRRVGSELMESEI